MHHNCLIYSLSILETSSFPIYSIQPTTDAPLSSSRITIYYFNIVKVERYGFNVLSETDASISLPV